MGADVQASSLPLPNATTSHVPVMRPLLPAPTRILPRLERSHARRAYANRGPEVQELEARFAEHFGVDASQVVTAANATLALQGAVTVADVPSWVTPSFTFVATAAAVAQAGRELVLHDVEPDTWALPGSPGGVGHEVGLLPVVPFGTAVDLNRWDASREVVIDAAACMGPLLSNPDSLASLPSRWAVIVSLHATKVLGIGEGGVAIFGDPDRARAFRSWTNFGFSHTATLRTAAIAGTNAKLTEFAAAVAHVALDDWAQERDDWLAARSMTDAASARLGITQAPGQAGEITPYWVVQLPAELIGTDALNPMAELQQDLEQSGVGTHRWWPQGCHEMPAYRSLSSRSLPTTERLARETLGLPMFRGISAVDVTRVETALTALLASHAARSAQA
jgi:dTDP-4-amino-4,6-dideoxygalactose transaminase